MELILFLILACGLGIFFHYAGILRSVIGILAFLVFSVVLLLFVIALTQDAALRWSMLISVGIVLPLAVGLRWRSRQKQLRWMRESEEWLAQRRAGKTPLAE